MPIPHQINPNISAGNKNPNNKNFTAQSNFKERQTYSQNYRNQQPPEPMDVSSGYTHLRKPPSNQTRRSNNVFRPREVQDVNTAYSEPTPHVNLDEYYDYRPNDVYDQPNTNEQFNPCQENYKDNNFNNVEIDEIDESENFPSNALIDLQDT